MVLQKRSSLEIWVLILTQPRTATNVYVHGIHSLQRFHMLATLVGGLGQVTELLVSCVKVWT